MADSLIDSLARAAQAAPEDLPLRLHLAELLVEAGRGQEAVGHCAAVLAQEPDSVRARDLMLRALGPVSPTPPSAPGPQDAGVPGPQAAPSSAPEDTTSDEPGPEERYDWNLAEEEMKDPTDAFVTSGDVGPLGEEPAGPLLAQEEPAANLWEVEDPGVALRDVGGMETVKARLEVSFLAPMRNPELRRMYGKSLKDGLLLYGPPGCGAAPPCTRGRCATSSTSCSRRWTA